MMSHQLIRHCGGSPEGTLIDDSNRHEWMVGWMNGPEIGSKQQQDTTEDKRKPLH